MGALMKQSDRGFAMILFLSLLPILITGTLIAFALINTIQADLAMKYECRHGGIQGQKMVGPLLASLLKLNPRAVQLRAKKAQAIIEISTATISRNPVALSAATKKYLKVLKQQEDLDGLQKQIIKQANLILHSAREKTKFKLMTTSRSASNIFARFSLLSLVSKSVKLAVSPDISDIAPIYRLEKDFETAQSLAHEWHFQIKTMAPFSYFIPGTYNYKKACAVTLHKESSQWQSKIITGKYSLKSVW